MDRMYALGVFDGYLMSRTRIKMLLNGSTDPLAIKISKELAQVAHDLINWRVENICGVMMAQSSDQQGFSRPLQDG